MSRTVLRGLMVCGLIMAVMGCSHYYRVTDPASGKTYYTTKINDAGRAGAVKIKDEKTGSTVTLQSSEVKEISEDEYEAGVKAPTVVTQPPVTTQPSVAK